MKTSLLGLGIFSLLVAQDVSAANYHQGLGVQLFLEQLEEENVIDPESMENSGSDANAMESDAAHNDTTSDATPLSDMIDSSKVLTRAELVALIVDERYPQTEIENCFWDIASEQPPTFDLVFTDVPVTHMYAKHICIALRDSWVKGFRDGSFHPERTVNMAEASKIISRAYALAPFAEIDTKGSWFSPYLYALTVRNAVPASITSLQHPVTGRELMEILMRLSNDVTWEPSRSFDDFMPRPVAIIPSTPAPTTDSASSKATSAPASSAAVSAASSVASVQTSASSKGAFWNPFD